MSEIPETGPVSVDDVLQAIQQKNIAQAKSHFQDVMAQKVNDTLENEKVRIASQVFNPHVDTNEPAPTAAELAADEEETEEFEEEELSLEDEVEAAFEEEEFEEDAEVS